MRQAEKFPTKQTEISESMTWHVKNAIRRNFLQKADDVKGCL